jgi:tetratricopeptide (TPR) repeat protein
MKKILVLLALLIGLTATSSAKEKFDLQLYDLMYKSFVYTNDLENAYKVAKKIVEKIPFSIKWRKRLAQLALWLNKPEEAFRNYLYVYNKTHDKEIEKTLFMFPYPEVIDLKIKIYEKEIKNGNYKNAVELAKLYEYKGYPEKAFNLMKNLYKKTKDETFLYEYIKYAVKLGKDDVLLKHLSFIKYLSLQEKIEIAQLFIAKNKYNEALEVLRYVDKIPDNKDYYELLSYVLFQLGDYEKLIKLLNYLYATNKIDQSNLYLLSSYYYSKKDYEKLEQILKNAIEKYNLTNLYPEYINILIINKKYKEALNILENKKSYFKNEKNYYLLIAQVYAKLGYNKKALKIYENLLSNYNLTENDKKEILWFLIDNAQEFEDVLENYIPYFVKDKQLYLPVINAYLRLQYVDKPYLIAKKFLPFNKNNISFLILYGDIMNLQTKFEESSYFYNKAWKIANEKLKKDPAAIYDKEFLRNYIRLSIMYNSPAKIRKLLKIAKNVFTYEEYINLKMDYYLSFNEFEPAFYIYNYKRDF